MALVNEWIFELFETSSEEIIAKTKQEEAEYYLPKLNELSAESNHLKNILKRIISMCLILIVEISPP